MNGKSVLCLLDIIYLDTWRSCARYLVWRYGLPWTLYTRQEYTTSFLDK